jgi:hypothetical protein
MDLTKSETLSAIGLAITYFSNPWAIAYLDMV